MPSSGRRYHFTSLISYMIIYFKSFYVVPNLPNLQLGRSDYLKAVGGDKVGGEKQSGAPLLQARLIVRHRVTVGAIGVNSTRIHGSAEIVLKVNDIKSKSSAVQCLACKVLSFQP